MQRKRLTRRHLRSLIISEIRSLKEDIETGSITKHEPIMVNTRDLPLVKSLRRNLQRLGSAMLIDRVEQNKHEQIQLIAMLEDQDEDDPWAFREITLKFGPKTSKILMPSSSAAVASVEGKKIQTDDGKKFGNISNEQSTPKLTSVFKDVKNDITELARIWNRPGEIDLSDPKFKIPPGQPRPKYNVYGKDNDKLMTDSKLVDGQQMILNIQYSQDYDGLLALKGVFPT